jgi:hypothetical protein
MGSLPRYVQRMKSSVHSGVLGYRGNSRTFSEAYSVRRLKRGLSNILNWKIEYGGSCRQPMNVAVQQHILLKGKQSRFQENPKSVLEILTHDQGYCAQFRLSAKSCTEFDSHLHQVQLVALLRSNYSQQHFQRLSLTVPYVMMILRKIRA